MTSLHSATSTHSDIHLYASLHHPLPTRYYIPRAICVEYGEEVPSDMRRLGNVLARSDLHCCACYSFHVRSSPATSYYGAPNFECSYSERPSTSTPSTFVGQVSAPENLGISSHDPYRSSGAPGNAGNRQLDHAVITLPSRVYLSKLLGIPLAQHASSGH